MRITSWLALSTLTVIAFATWHAGGEAAPLQAEFYVASHGDDEDPGTKELPWKTLAAVNDRQFAPGDTVYFARGSRFEGGFVVSSSGTPEKPIVFTAYGEGPLLVRSASSSPVRIDSNLL